MTTWKAHRRKLLSNPEIKREYEELQPRLEVIRQIIKARAARAMGYSLRMEFARGARGRKGRAHM